MMSKYELIAKLHSNKVLTTLEASFVKSKLNDFVDAEDMLLYSVRKYKLNYNELPEEFSRNEKFLALAVVNNPKIYEQLKSVDVNIFRKVNKLLTIEDKNSIKKSLEAKTQDSTK